MLLLLQNRSEVCYIRVAHRCIFADAASPLHSIPAIPTVLSRSRALTNALCASSIPYCFFASPVRTVCFDFDAIRNTHHQCLVDENEKIRRDVCGCTSLNPSDARVSTARQCTTYNSGRVSRSGPQRVYWLVLWLGGARRSFVFRAVMSCDVPCHVWTLFAAAWNPAALASRLFSVPSLTTCLALDFYLSVLGRRRAAPNAGTTSRASTTSRRSRTRRTPSRWTRSSGPRPRSPRATFLPAAGIVHVG